MKRRDLMTLAGFAALPGFAANDRLAGGIVDEAQAKLTRERFGDLRIYFNGPTEQVQSMTAGSLRLKAGMSPHPPHEHPEEEFMLITEGSGEIILNGKTTRVGPGSMMYCASNRSHGIINTGKNSLMFYFWKWQK